MNFVLYFNQKILINIFSVLYFSSDFVMPSNIFYYPILLSKIDKKRIGIDACRREFCDSSTVKYDKNTYFEYFKCVGEIQTDS